MDARHEAPRRPGARETRRRRPLRAAFKSEWDRWHYGQEQHRFPLPATWGTTIDQFHEAGLPTWMWREIVEKTMAKDTVDDRFKFACGIAWKKIGNLIGNARAIAEKHDPNRAWDERDAEIVIDAAVHIWYAYYCQAAEADPPEGAEEEVRQQAREIYPEEVSPAALIAAAQNAGGAETSAITDYLEDESEPEFAERIAASFALGWATDEVDENANTEDTDEHFRIALAHALAARSAGYEDDILRYAIFLAARERTRDAVDRLHVAKAVLERERTGLISHAAELAARVDLDHHLKSARAEQDARHRARAKHIATCTGCNWCKPTAFPAGW